MANQFAIQILHIRVDKIEPNPYNPNVLKGEKYEALKRDVKQGNYDPILVSPKAVFYGNTKTSDRYVIIDGEWRCQAARELKLPSIKAEIKNISINEAKVVTFKKNRQRGTLDPIKEAQLFDGEVTRGLTEEQVAQRFGVSRSYVAGRRSLLNLSAEVVELFESPEKTLKKRLEKKIRSDIEERRGLPEYVEVTNEEVEAHVEEQVAEVVPRGTLTPGHLKALAGLPKQQQVEVAEDVVHTDLTVRETEEKVKSAHEKLERAKRFKEALEKARQKTCPDCGGQPKGFHFYNENRFNCSECHRAWDFMVTKEELKAQQTERETSAKTDRKEQIKKHIKNPKYIRRKETVEQLTEEIRGWVLRKVGELVEIQTIKVVGTRKDGQKVNIVFPGSWGKGLDFGVGAKEEGDFWYHWPNRISFRMEAKDYKTVDANTKIDLGVAASPEHRVELHRFFDEIVHTDKDPFLPKKGVELLLKKYGEQKAA